MRMQPGYVTVVTVVTMVTVVVDCNCCRPRPLLATLDLAALELTQRYHGYSECCIMVDGVWCTMGKTILSPKLTYCEKCGFYTRT